MQSIINERPAFDHGVADQHIKFDLASEDVILSAELGTIIDPENDPISIKAKSDASFIELSDENDKLTIDRTTAVTGSYQVKFAVSE